MPLPTREITRRLNRKFGAGTFRCRKCRMGWPNGEFGTPMFEMREGHGWSFVAYGDDMRDSGYLLPVGKAETAPPQATATPAAPRRDARAEIDAAAARLIALVAAEIERPTDLSLAEALEDWTRGDADLGRLRAAVEPLGLLGLDEARQERDAVEMRLATRAA
jgi:hypothetical protein